MYHIIDKCAGEWLEPFEIMEGIRYSMSKRYKQVPLTIDNNYLHRTAEMDIVGLASELLKDQAIITPTGVLFQKHANVKNPFYNFIQYLLDKRNAAKEEMKKHPKGSEPYKAFDLLQKGYKISVNAVYGAAGQFSSIFYNLYLCTAVTGSGRGAISASILMFEGLMSNDSELSKFGNLNEVLTFIEFCCEDQRNRPQRFNDWDVLDRNITREECMLRLIQNCGWNNYVPNDRDVDIIWKTVNNMNQRELNIVYYKNNLFKFLDNSKLTNLILKILCDLETPFLNPNKPPENIKEYLETLTNLIYEYVYYRHIHIDKLQKV
jgi:hypothetical protein